MEGDAGRRPLRGYGAVSILRNPVLRSSARPQRYRRLEASDSFVILHSRFQRSDRRLPCWARQSRLFLLSRDDLPLVDARSPVWLKLQLQP